MFGELAYLDHLQLNLVVPVFGAAANSLDDCVNKHTRPFAIECSRLLAIFILAVVGAVSVEEVVGEELLDTVEELLHQT